MEANFWHDKWQRNEIGFHNSEVHPLLLRYWPTLALPDDARVLVPMAGKSLDVLWLSEQGFSVAAAELSRLAADAFFAEHNWPARKTERARHVVYSHGQLEFWVGDFFALRDENLPAFDAVYDRAALIALPPEMRKRYADTLAALLKPGAQYLLISLEYPDDRPNGPPFAIGGEEIARLFGDRFAIHCHGRHPSAVRDQSCFEVVYTLRLNA